jgi:aminomethyltransferase
MIEGAQPAESGALLYAVEKEVGQITSSVVSPRLRRVIALGYVHKDFWQPGTELSIHRDGNKAGAIVTALPFLTSP